jgi:hypothetical protein
MQVGATYDVGSQVVEGQSDDAFHEDLYSRKRTVPALSGQAFFDLLSKLRGVINYRHFSYEADQTLLMNWSDRYIINPEQTDIHRKLLVGSESLESDFFATRWIAYGLGLPLRVSGYFDILTEDSWYVAEPNVLVWMDSFNQTFKDMNLGAGASYELAGKALVGAEVKLNRGRLEDKLSTEDGLVNFKTVDLKGGAEYRVLSWLAVRGGYARSTQERFMGVPEENFVAKTLSAGLGCLLKNESLTIDAAFSQRTTEPENDLGVDRQMRYQTVMLYGRYLF